MSGSFGGLVSLMATTMTVVSSLATTWLTKKLGVGTLLASSTALTAIGLLGFSFAGNIYWLLLFALPLGFGAGAIDSALNNYVANHYKAHHMSWLHAFWGIGATAGPALYALMLLLSGDWRKGFLLLGIVQVVVLVVLIFALPLWKRVTENKIQQIKDHLTLSGNEPTFVGILKGRSVQYATASFLLYVGLEFMLGLWLATYLVAVQGVSVESAALWTGLYYGAITVGRIITGFIVSTLGNVALIRYGIVLSLIGMVCVALSVAPYVSFFGVALIGLGFAPIFPGMIHETPTRFGKSKSSKAMSLQMVAGYVGATTIPPLVGLLVAAASFEGVILVALVLGLGLLVSTELTNRRSAK